MNFASDNWAGVHPAIAQRLSADAVGYATAYGGSVLDQQVAQQFNALFEREVAVFFVATGTAANSLALAAVNRPGGVVFAHSDAHMIDDECGAPEFFTQGARLQGVGGALGKMAPAQLRAEIARCPAEFVHRGQPMAMSLTQATEFGTCYSLQDIQTLAAIAQAQGVPLHMDGARFANALVALEVSPAAMTWQAGVDMLSFGATKNGCWCAEALVVFRPELTDALPFLRKRAGQLLSKSRFIASQFAAYFADDLWLRLARHANAKAQQLQQGITQASQARLAWPTQTNEVFCIVSKHLAQQLQQHGAFFHIWVPPRSWSGVLAADEVLMRLVCCYATTDEEVQRLLSLLNTV